MATIRMGVWVWIKARSQKCTGIFLAGGLEDLPDRTDLDCLPLAHDHHMVREVAHHRQVVGDENEGNTHLPAELVEKSYHLCLHGNIEGGNGLIADDKFRLQRKRACDRNALALATGKLMWITAHMLRQKVHLTQEFTNTLAPFRFRQDFRVDHPGLGNELEDGHTRIEGLRGILKHHLQIAT